MSDSALPATKRSDSANRASLGDQVTQGLGWSFVNNILGRLGNVLSGVVMARLLIPEDFGVFAVALVVLNAGLSMNELGVSLALIRWPGDVRGIAPTIATLSVSWSCVLYAVCFFTAPSIAAALGSPSASTYIRVLGLIIVVDALVTVPAAMITRAFMQRIRMVIDLISLLASATVGIGLALLGASAWAIVLSLFAANIVSSMLTVAWAPMRCGFGFDRRVLGALLRFGLPLASSSLLMFLMLNTDYVVVGHELGPAALGFYLLAFNVCSWPVNLVSLAVRRVSFAGFSRVADDSARASLAFCRSAALLLGVTLPLSAILAVYAEPTVRVVYGEEWVPASRVLPFLCVLGAARIILELAYDFLAAVGRTSVNLALYGAWFLLLVPSLMIGARVDGIRGVGIGHAALAVIVVVPAFGVALAGGGVSLTLLGRFSVTPLLSGTAVVASGLVMNRLLEDSPVMLLLLGSTTSGVLALLALLPMRRMVLGSLGHQSPVAD